MIKRWIFAGIASVVSIAAATVMTIQERAPLPAPAQTTTAGRPLDQLMPGGALLYIEAKDFSRLLNAWNSSPEKANWVESDNHSVFSQSRLFLRLQRFFRRFEGAAGMPANTDFVTATASKQSALGLYDIGKVEFLYITHLGSGDFLNSALWQSRNKFQTRAAGGVTFFLGSDEDSKQVVAFAVAGGYLILSTREDLMVRTLQLLDKQPERSVSQESWYSAALSSAAKSQGELRMVMDLKRIAVDPRFRTYWVQQNISEMQSYNAAISDLYFEGDVYREERVLLRKQGAESDEGQTARVADLLGMVPADYGFYQAREATQDEVLEALQMAILPSESEANEPEHQAPGLVLTGGEVGSESDLETRIDVAAKRGEHADAGWSALKQQLETAGPMAMLEVQSTDRFNNGGLPGMPSLLVINAANNWDPEAIKNKIQSQLGKALSVSQLGVQWHEADQTTAYMQLDGLHPLYMAIQGKLLCISNQPAMMASALKATGSPKKIPGLTYVAAFNHTRERQNFYELSRILDLAPKTNGWNQDYAPRFFSRNMASLSRALARLESEKVVEREENDRVFQTVTYTWAH